jgi:hypothetical protein
MVFGAIDAIDHMPIAIANDDKRCVLPENA